MCGLQLYDIQHVHEHCIHVHGLPSGIATLKPRPTITLDKDTAFACPDLKNFEDMGMEGKKLAVKSVYTQSIAKQVFVSFNGCLLYTSPSPRDRQKSRMPSSA